MSRPTKLTEWGKLLFDGKELDVLDSFHLNEAIFEKATSYMKIHSKMAHAPFAPWLNYQPQWAIKDNKLYLTDIHIRKLTNKLVDICGTNEIFASWADKPMRLLVAKSKQKSKTVNDPVQGKRVQYFVDAEILILHFKHGVLVKEEKIMEYIPTLKNYMEEKEDDN